MDPPFNRSAPPVRPRNERSIWFDPLSFALPSLLVLILSLCSWQAMQSTDDLRYAELAISFLQDPAAYDANSHHQRGRIGLVWPLAACFYLFGVSEITLAILPLLCAILTAPLVVFLGRHFFGRRVGAMAGLLYAVFPPTAQTATVFLPEPVLTFVLCLASALFLSASKHSGRVAAYRGLLAGALTGVAYLITEVGALMLPIFLAYSIAARKFRTETWPIVAGFMAVAGLELLYYATSFGKPFYRFTELGGAYTHDPMLVSANVDLVFRLFAAYPRLFVYPDTFFGLFGGLMIAGGLWGLIRFHQSSFFVIWAAIILAFYNFMSASLHQYVALPVAARLIVPGCIPLIILAAKLLVDCWNGLSARSSARTAFRWSGRLVYSALLGLLVVSSLLATYLGHDSSHTSVVARNSEQVAKSLANEPSILLVSDQMSGRVVHFYRGFNSRDTILEFKEGSDWLHETADPGPRKPVFVVLNGIVINEKKINGALYGGDLSLGTEEQELIGQFLSDGREPKLRWMLQKGPLFGTILESHPTRRLLRNAELMKQRFSGSSPLGQVRLFELERPYPLLELQARIRIPASLENPRVPL